MNAKIKILEIKLIKLTFPIQENGSKLIKNPIFSK